MHVLHRRFLLVPAIAALLLTGCTRRQPAGIFIDPAFGPLIPTDTRFMAGVRLDKLRETPLYKKLNGQFEFEKRLNLFSERTGLDPNKDIWQVLAVSNGTRMLVMARGRFTVGEMEPRLGDLGATRTKYKDYTLIGNPETSVVFLNPGVAVAGAQKDLQGFLDYLSEHSEMPPSVAAKLRAMPAADQIWAVADGMPTSVQLSGPDTTGMKSMLSNFLGYIKSAVVGVHVDQGADLGGRVECVSNEGAQRVNDALKGLLGMARLNTRNDQMEMLKVYDNVKVSRNATAVDVQAQVPADLVDPLLKMLPQVRSRSGARLAAPPLPGLPEPRLLPVIHAPAR